MADDSNEKLLVNQLDQSVPYYGNHRNKKRYTVLGEIYNNKIVFANEELMRAYVATKPQVGWWCNFWHHLGRDCFRYSGVESRSTYFKFIGIATLLVGLFALGFYSLGVTPWASLPQVASGWAIAYIVVFRICYSWLAIASIAAYCRRLHDINRTGWWQVLIFVPVIGYLVLLVWALMPTVYQQNLYAVADEDYFRSLALRQQAKFH